MPFRWLSTHLNLCILFHCVVYSMHSWQVWLPQTGLFPWECLQLALDLAFSFHHTMNVVLSTVYCVLHWQWYVQYSGCLCFLQQLLPLLCYSHHCCSVMAVGMLCFNVHYWAWFGTQDGWGVVDTGVASWGQCNPVLHLRLVVQWNSCASSF